MVVGNMAGKSCQRQKKQRRQVERTSLSFNYPESIIGADLTGREIKKNCLRILANLPFLKLEGWEYSLVVEFLTSNMRL